MALVITPSGASAITFADFTAGFYSTVGKYWQKLPIVHPWKYAITAQKSPTSTGSFVKRFGKVSRPITRITVHYVGASIADVLTAYGTDRDAVMNVANGLSLPGWADSITNAECTLFDLAPGKNGQYVIGCGGNYRAKVVAAFLQMRE